MRMSARRAIILFVALLVVVLTMSTWWVIFMAQLIDEKVEMAEELGASPEYVEMVHEQEVRRQIMLGSEGLFFLTLILIGAWLIYRSLVKTEELKFQEQNFLMAVTHELKTPLASLKVYLDTLESPKIPEEKKKSVLPRMQKDVVRLEKIVENILIASRFERHNHRLNMNRVDLSAMVQNCVDDIERLPRELPREITANIQRGIYLNADSDALRRAIMAVLENGMKYHNGEKIEMTIDLTSEGEKVRLRIADKGIGLTRKDLQAVFDRFYRAGSEMTREAEGTGLGLYLSSEIIKAHGGTIKASSEGPGKGAAFAIELKRVSE